MNTDLDNFLANESKSSDPQKLKQKNEDIKNQLHFFDRILDSSKDEDECLTLQQDYYSLAFYAFYLDDKEVQ